LGGDLAEIESLRERITTLRGRGLVVFFCDNGRRGYLATRIALTTEGGAS
jgi:hypothetical protein